MNALLLLALACGPKAPPPPPPAPVVEKPVRSAPPPGQERPFKLPDVSKLTLSNGVPVSVVENHEVPLVYVQLSFLAGSQTDPVGKEGLAELAMNLLNEGAGKYNAEGLSQALKRLGSGLGTGAGTDGSSINISSLDRNLDATLALMADTLLRPTFPQTELDLQRTQMIDDLQSRRSNPNAVAAMLLTRTLDGARYRARVPTEASLRSITVKDLKQWASTWLKPDKAMLLVGGATKPEVVQPLLEKHLGGWTGTSPAFSLRGAHPAAGAATLHVIDMPGKTQTVILGGSYLGQPTDPDYFSLLVANVAVGGSFMSRINLNLREEKGYTYGARSSVSFNQDGVLFNVSAPVQSEHTAASLQELFKELNGVASAKPLTEEEINTQRTSLVLSYPLRFESPDYLLGQQELVWRYRLPTDWTASWREKVRGVTTASAQAAWTARIHPEQLQWVLVGDWAKIKDSVTALGMPIVMYDADGKPLAAPSGK